MILRTGSWLADEEERLRGAMKETHANSKTKWRVAAQAVGSRNARGCQRHWENNLRPGLKKGDWSEEEKEELRTLYYRYHRNIARVAKHFPNRGPNKLNNFFLRAEFQVV